MAFPSGSRRQSPSTSSAATRASWTKSNRSAVADVPHIGVLPEAQLAMTQVQEHAAERAAHGLREGEVAWVLRLRDVEPGIAFEHRGDEAAAGAAHMVADEQTATLLRNAPHLATLQAAGAL